ncbi:MAG: phosphoribosylanthranilate isomerase [Bacteroidetes bacterium]|nr:phosphoribosylanthranilate isomerase [Bacteroidota bacterium]MCY4204542.1 phosphoribosylanthranilate isomerase [Bacteroidota bacterium]
MSCKVKICGLTTLADARFCAGAGADYLGFIQHPPSPRYISPDRAKEIKEWVHGPETVGVFVNVDAETVNLSSETAGFDIVQLHGDESPAYCRRITRPVIKAFSIRPNDTVRALSRIMDAYQGCVDYFLLDTWHSELPGGTGKVFDWSIAKNLATNFPTLLAGGLNPSNVKEAVRTVSPWGIDLSSGIEEIPGTKDFDLVTKFFESISEGDTEL